jgi:hypothetical protein
MRLESNSFNPLLNRNPHLILKKQLERASVADVRVWYGQGSTGAGKWTSISPVHLAVRGYYDVRIPCFIRLFIALRLGN